MCSLAICIFFGEMFTQILGPFLVPLLNFSKFFIRAGCSVHVRLCMVYTNVRLEARSSRCVPSSVALRPCLIRCLTEPGVASRLWLLGIWTQGFMLEQSLSHFFTIGLHFCRWDYFLHQSSFFLQKISPLSNQIDVHPDFSFTLYNFFYREGAFILPVLGTEVGASYMLLITKLHP